MFVRLSATGVHCDHTVHYSADLCLWLDSTLGDFTIFVDNLAKALGSTGVSYNVPKFYELWSTNGLK